jgi:hypothetical protein
MRVALTAGFTKPALAVFYPSRSRGTAARRVVRRGRIVRRLITDRGDPFARAAGDLGER